MQVNLKNSVQFNTEHVITTCILIDWRQCTDLKAWIAHIIKNQRPWDYVKREDRENEADANVIDNMFSIF